VDSGAVENMFCGVISHASLLGRSGFGGCQENLTDCIGLTLDFSGGGIMVWGCFSGFGLVFLLLVKS